VALCGSFITKNPHRILLNAGTPGENAPGDQQVDCFSQNKNNVDIHQKYWLAGFIEGEGSFNVSFKLSTQSKLGFYPSPLCFNVHFHESES
jgi:hypothetical protein